MSSELEKLLINSKPCRLLVNLRRQTTPNYPTALSDQIDSTYSHTVRIIKKLERLGIVSSERKGRKKEVRLTDKGEEVADRCAEFLQVINS